MKTYKNKTKTKLALFAGATATAMLATHAQADVAGDALINKLEQKGVLSAEEAQGLRVENQQDYNNSFTNNFDKAFDKTTGTPDWVTGYNIYGSFRGRYEQFSGDNRNAVDRTRPRYRLFLGATITMTGNLEAGFRIGSGDTKGSLAQGNPLSQNSTMGNNWSDKGLYVDLAYGKWTPISGGDLTLSTTFGKMERNVFDYTWMVIDPDLTPEGGVIQGKYDINKKQSIAFTGGLFYLEDVSGSTRDPAMYGAQLSWNAKWTDKWSSMLGVAAMGIMNPEELTTANAPQIIQGNTRYTSGPYLGAPKYNYTPFIGDASVTYKLASFPFYAGAFPLTLKGEIMSNPGAPNNNNGYWAGVILGKAGGKGTWDLTYRYEYLESDAWYDQIVDDDNVGYYKSAPGGGGLAGYYGGTNIKGHFVKLNYSITDSLMFSFTCYLNSLINPVVNGTKEPHNSDMHVMADLMWKF